MKQKLKYHKFKKDNKLYMPHAILSVPLWEEQEEGQPDEEYDISV